MSDGIYTSLHRLFLLAIFYISFSSSISGVSPLRYIYHLSKESGWSCCYCVVLHASAVLSPFPLGLFRCWMGRICLRCLRRRLIPSSSAMQSLYIQRFKCYKASLQASSSRRVLVPMFFHASSVACLVAHR